MSATQSPHEPSPRPSSAARTSRDADSQLLALPGFESFSFSLFLSLSVFSPGIDALGRCSRCGSRDPARPF